MKIRSGFVSNSSSSSFVIISKGELTEEMLKEALGDKAESFCYGANTFIDNIMGVIDEQETVSFGWYGFEVPIDNLVHDGVHVYLGSHADNEGNEIHSELSQINLTVKTDNIKIIWEPR